MELDVPELRCEGAETGEGGAGVSVVATAATGQGGNDGLWDDDHMAYFYETLPSLSDVVPSTALHKGKEPDEETAEASSHVVTDGSGVTVQVVEKAECAAEDSLCAAGKEAKNVEQHASESDGVIQSMSTGDFASDSAYSLYVQDMLAAVLVRGSNCTYIGALCRRRTNKCIGRCKC